MSIAARGKRFKERFNTGSSLLIERGKLRIGRSFRADFLFHLATKC